MVPRGVRCFCCFLVVVVLVTSVATASSIDLDLVNDEPSIAAVAGEAFDDLNDDQPQQQQHNQRNFAIPGVRHHREQVRCFCNQPHCVSQGYMCRGRGCFTDLPLLISGGGGAAGGGAANSPHHHSSLHQVGGRPEHAVFSGCLDQKTERSSSSSCPPGKLCCDQDMCNHVDSPAMRLRLNKTLQVLLGEHHRSFGSSSSSSSSSSGSPTGQAVPTNSWLDKWLRMATIAVPICGFVMILLLATLAARLLKPLPSPNDKLNGFRMPPETTPPLLGHTGHLMHNKLLV